MGVVGRGGEGEGMGGGWSMRSGDLCGCGQKSDPGQATPLG